MGFAHVYDLAVGRAAWAAAGLPLEGALSALLTAGKAARRDVFTCRLGDAIDGMAGMMAAKDQEDCIVLNEQGIVTGRTRRRVVEAAGKAAVLEEVMELGPTTVRPDERLEGLVDRMRQRGVRSIVVATLDGKFVGVLYRDEAEMLLGIESSEIERE